MLKRQTEIKALHIEPIDQGSKTKNTAFYRGTAPLHQNAKTTAENIHLHCNTQILLDPRPVFGKRGGNFNYSSASKKKKKTHTGYDSQSQQQQQQPHPTPLVFAQPQHQHQHEHQQQHSSQPPAPLPTATPSTRLG